MSTSIEETAVQREITVPIPPERAFELYTDGMASWWPPDHHLLEAELAEIVIEGHAGGRIYDRGVDGSTLTWAHVLAYEPPRRLVFSWDIDPQWKIEEDPARRSEVEVTFEPAGEGTLVRLRHSHLERHGDGWEGMREAVDSPNGWGRGLEAFSKQAAA